MINKNSKDEDGYYLLCWKNVIPKTVEECFKRYPELTKHLRVWNDD